MKRILTRMAVGVLSVMLLLIAPCSFHLAGSARVTAENGAAISYRVYRSILGQIYLEDPSGAPLIIYARKRIVTYPDGDVPIVHTRSWIILNPVRSILPIDPPLTLGFDPRLEIEPKRIMLNVASAKRVTISF